MLLENKLKKRKKRISVNDIIPHISSCKSYSEIARKLNCNYVTIINKLKEAHMLCYNEYRKYEVNHTYFDKIDCQNKSYILGFLYADGYNNTSKNKVVLSLHHQDTHILNSISKLIQPDKPLFCFKNSSMVELTINSKNISQKLNQLGLFKKKTFMLKFPTDIQLPKEYHSHFIRGYFDGDGCISITKRKNGYLNIKFNVAGTKNFVEIVQNILIENLNLNTTIIRKNNKTYVVEYSGRNNVKSIGNYLYKDAILYLNRKKEKFDQLQLCNYKVTYN